MDVDVTDYVRKSWEEPVGAHAPFAAEKLLPGAFFFLVSINASSRERERFHIDGGAENVVLDLLQGMNLVETCNKHDLEIQELREFVQSLVDGGVLEWSSDSVDSSMKCHDVDPPLDSLNVLLTNACNLSCEHCYVSSGKKMANEMDGDEWLGILKEARRLGVFELNVSGGEATLHRDFVRIAEYVGSVPTFNANLNTNGFLLRPRHEDAIAQAFKSVQVSIDDSDATKHDAFRGRDGSFSRSMGCISRLIRRGVETNIGFTLTKDTLRALDGVVDLAERIGVTVLNIGLVSDIGRASKNQLVKISRKGQGAFNRHDDPFMDQVYEKMKQLARRRGSLRILLPFRVPTESMSVETVEKQRICDGDMTQILYVMPNGDIMPCDKLPMGAFAYGNARTGSLSDVWLSRQMKAFKLMSPKQLPKCKTCPHLKICGGACVARAYQDGGSIESPDWTSCVIAQKISSELRV